MKKFGFALMLASLLSVDSFAVWFSGTIEEVSEYPNSTVVTLKSTGFPTSRCTSATICTKRITGANAEHLKRILTIALTAKVQGATVEMDLCGGNTAWCGVKLK